MRSLDGPRCWHQGCWLGRRHALRGRSPCRTRPGSPAVQGAMQGVQAATAAVRQQVSRSLGCPPAVFEPHLLMEPAAAPGRSDLPVERCSLSVWAAAEIADNPTRRVLVPPQGNVAVCKPLCFGVTCQAGQRCRVVVSGPPLRVVGMPCCPTAAHGYAPAGRSARPPVPAPPLTPLLLLTSAPVPPPACNMQAGAAKCVMRSRRFV